MFAQWGLPHCAFFDKRKRGENAVNENQEKTTAEVVTLEKTQPASEFVLEMTDIEKQFPGVKALDHAKLRLRPGTVHALMGENGAGKSTLMKCLFGIYKQDGGEIRIDGQSVHFTGPKNAMENGVAMVHQELNQVLQRSVMENIWLGRFPKQGGLVSHKVMFEETKKVFDDLDIPVNPKTIIGKLSVSQRQMVEIAKAVSYNAKILVLDEPTSSLTQEEVEHLFVIINKLRAKGVAMVYISHKMEEILRISDEVTIMRDGQWIATEYASGLTTDKIIKLMVGRDLTERFPPKTNVPGDVVMEVKNLTGKYMPSCIDVSFNLHKGEILGVAGLVGSRRTELLETIFGIAHHDKGEILKDGKPIQNKTPKDAIANGFAMLTEERRATGIFGGMSILFNSVIANIKNYRNGILLSNATMKTDTQWVIESMRVKTPSQKTHIRSLSGGNQQKVIIGRWLLTKPEILLLDEPTRGIDVGAKYEIYQLIINLANEGKSVIVVSSEMPELLGICDRIMVMSNGHLAGTLDIKDANQEEIMRLAAMYV
ncbi:MAG: galactose/methyl galactoside ABC transporter ATP-binding protein MglA [Anaerotignum sp.]|jgi:methyl-galactoside transport system ATP-binding protein|nr:galactose/methyl galactoside ABC transporter ATP-binding protein MglA [Anaerotignum sp.]